MVRDVGDQLTAEQRLERFGQLTANVVLFEVDLLEERLIEQTADAGVGFHIARIAVTGVVERGAQVVLNHLDVDQAGLQTNLDPGQLLSDATMALLADLDRARIVVDDTLTSCTVSHGRLDLFEERMNEHIQTYTTTAPSSVLGAIMPDLLEVQGVAAKRQPATVQFRLSEISSVLSLLAADALMKLGQVERADHWYGTARLAADDTPNLQLRAQVRAQHAMLPYYYGRIERTIALAREAQALLPGVACDATALATAAEARALARLGDLDSAEKAVAKTQQLAESLDMGTNDEAFRFTEKRLLLYLSGTLTYMGQTTRATRIQTEALGLYRQNPDIVIDPALIHLDAAIGHANDGVFDDACQLATDVLSQLPTEHRTTIVTARAKDVIKAIPEARRQLPSVTQLRELMASESSGSTP
ncbi:hypothetical protein AB0F85_27490 [Nocardia fluminea]|uniref:hypothetical protein n=1 Tax=Nocardia fluminea TaxID=134984 RepID=UPI0033EA3817